MKKVLSTTEAPEALGPYSQAIETETTVYCSGQLGLDPKTGAFAGEDVSEQTKQAFENIKSVLKEAGLGLQNVVKTTVLLSDIEDFGPMNEVYATFFEAPFPARSAFAVKDIPKGAKVEIEVIAVK